MPILYSTSSSQVHREIKRHILIKLTVKNEHLLIKFIEENESGEMIYVPWTTEFI